MVQSTSLIVAATTVATVLYTANPALGASIPLIRRDDEMDLVTRAQHSKANATEVSGHNATWWHKLYQEKSKDFQKVLKVFELYIKRGSEKQKKQILKELAAAEGKGKDKKTTTTKSFKASKEKAEKEEGKKTRRDTASEVQARDFEDDDLFSREFEDDDLFARDFEDDLFAREFDDDLATRDFDDDLVTRDMFEGLSSLEARDLFETLTALEARDFDDDLEARDLLERSDLYDDLD